MSTNRIQSHEPGSPEWHEQRRLALGGSEVAAVLGISPFESRFSLWHRKAGLAQPIQDSPEMEWGRRLESAILERWVEGNDDAYMWLTNRTYLRDGWMLASPDAIILNPSEDPYAIVEVKHPNYSDGWGEPGTDQIPLYYLTQARWYMHVLDLPVCHFAVLIGACDYREYVVHQDADDVALMIREGRAFLDSITAGERPDIDDSDATYQVVRRLHPEIDPENVEISADMATLIVGANRLAKAAAATRLHAFSTVLDFAGRAKHIDLNGRRIAYRTAKTLRDGTPGAPYLALDKSAEKHLADALPPPERTAS